MRLNLFFKAFTTTAAFFRFNLLSFNAKFLTNRKLYHRKVFCQRAIFLKVPVFVFYVHCVDVCCFDFINDGKTYRHRFAGKK
jgi:hypothetical protein